MQFSTITTIFALATAAVAVPTEVTARTDSGSCVNNQNQVCCNGILGIVTCIVQIANPTCSGDAYCCSTGDAPDTGLVVLDVTALNCVKIL